MADWLTEPCSLPVARDLAALLRCALDGARVGLPDPLHRGRSMLATAAQAAARAVECMKAGHRGTCPKLAEPADGPPP